MPEYHDEGSGGGPSTTTARCTRSSASRRPSPASPNTILRKRENFRAAFAGFEIERVVGFGDDDVARLMADEGIVRNRAKIEAAIANARAAAGLSLSGCCGRSP